MRLYEFTLPTHNNNGLSYELARKRWEAEAIKQAGGLTRQAGFANGVWHNEEGHEFKETVAQYRVACAETVRDALVAFAFDQFPDQEAIFFADLGEAHIVPNPKAA